MSARGGPAVAKGAGPGRAKVSSSAQHSFERLIRRHEDRVYCLSLRLLGDPDRALDVTQETFVRALQGLKDFRGESTFSTWLCRIAINLCYSERRRDGRRRLRNLGELLDDPSAEPRGRSLLLDDRAREPIEASESRELGALVREAVASLEEELRFVVVLRDLEQLSYEEVAAALEIPVGTVRSRLHRARDVLRQRLRRWIREEDDPARRERGGA